MKIQEKNGLVFIKYFIMQKFMFQNEMKCISHTNVFFEWSQYKYIHPYSKAHASASVASMLALAPPSHAIKTKACCKSH